MRAAIASPHGYHTIDSGPITGLINRLHRPAKSMSPALLAGLTAGEISSAALMRSVVAIGMRNPLGNLLPVLDGQLFNQLLVLQKHRAPRPAGRRLRPALHCRPDLQSLHSSLQLPEIGNLELDATGRIG
jgi:hypothetical protein